MVTNEKPFFNRNGFLVITLTIILFTANSPMPAAQQRSEQTMAPDYPPQLLTELKQIQQAALSSDYAYQQVAHLANNIGPRLSGSAQAQRAVEYVAGELRRLGLDVRLEKLLVPNWIRGEETAELVDFPGQISNTTQRIVLTALGGSVATSPKGLVADCHHC